MWEMFITTIICYGYLNMNFIKKVERGMLSVVMGSLYAALILSIFNCYYSRYNFIWANISSLSSFQINL